MEKEITRRTFLKAGGAGVLASVALPGGVLSLWRQSLKPGATAVARASLTNAREFPWAFAVDIRKCIGCGHCVRACKEENGVPREPEFNRTWVERYVVTENGDVLVDSPNAGIDGFTADHMNVKYSRLSIRKSFFVAKLCNQCQEPPCVRVCPVGATYATKEGVVLVDRNSCIGCRYCIQACPYGARFLDPRLKVADKCTWCYHRVTKGLAPACVEVCPVGARVFGDVTDPRSRVSKLLAEEQIGTLKPELGTEPMVYYIGLEKGVR